MKKVDERIYYVRKLSIDWILNYKRGEWPFQIKKNIYIYTYYEIVTYVRKEIDTILVSSQN